MSLKDLQLKDTALVRNEAKALCIDSCLQTQFDVPMRIFMGKLVSEFNNVTFQCGHRRGNFNLLPQMCWYIIEGFGMP